MAYINPKADGEWLKFNDMAVTKCSFDDAVTKNYGSTNETPNTPNAANAYMLIYMKKSELNDILCEVTENDVVSKCPIEIELSKELKQLATLNKFELIEMVSKLSPDDVLKFKTMLKQLTDKGTEQCDNFEIDALFNKNIVSDSHSKETRDDLVAIIHTKKPSKKRQLKKGKQKDIAFDIKIHCQ